MSLLRTARRVAVASAVHGRVQQKQAQRFGAAPIRAGAPAPAAAPAATAPPPAPAAPPMAAPAAVDPAQRLALLAQLGQLRDSGVLSAAEFEDQKARLLA